ncbi:MAG: restriction endonuclease subunit S [Chitinophagales bacterium]|nr:restriction endonuclease subunit S [Chitinophagales bacterium]
MSKIKVGEHIKIIPGFPFNSALFNNDGDGLPLIRIRDLLASKIETYYKGEFPKEYLIEQGDILIGMDGDFHIVKWRNKTKALLNQRIMKVAQKEGAKINIEYFYYFLFPFLSEVWEKTTATTVKHLSTYDVSEAEVEFPAFEVQQHIAKILSTADAVIEKTQAAIAKYKAIKQGMLQDLFTRGIDLQTGKLRPRYQDAPELYKESKLGWIPREWEEITLGEIGEFKNGINKDKAAFGHGTLFVNIGDAYLERLDCSSLNKVKVSIQEIQDYQLVHGDLIFVRSSVKPSGVGYNTIFFEFSEPVIFCGFMIRYRLYDKSDFLPAFYNSYFRFEEFRNRLMGVATVSANTNVNQVSLSQLSAIRPTTDEQIAIADRIAAINNKLQIEQAYLQKMQYIKKGLMEDLLSGRKCLNGDFDDLHDSCDVASSNQSFKSQQSNQP